MRACQLIGEVGAAERDREEKAQCRGLRVHLRRLRTVCDLVGLKLPHVVGRDRIRRATEKLGQRLDVLDIVVLGLVAEAAVRHVL